MMVEGMEQTLKKKEQWMSAWAIVVTHRETRARFITNMAAPPPFLFFVTFRGIYTPCVNFLMFIKRVAPKHPTIQGIDYTDTVKFSTQQYHFSVYFHLPETPNVNNPMDMSNLIMVNSSSMGGDGCRRCIGAICMACTRGTAVVVGGDATTAA
jgi:hypothetical protein